MLRLLLICCAALTLAGCATTGHFNERLDGWKGKNIDMVKRFWGPASDSDTLSDGSKTYTWHKSRGYRGVGQTNAYTRTTVFMAREKFCNINFQTAADGTIEAWSSSGNRCRESILDE